MKRDSIDRRSVRLLDLFITVVLDRVSVCYRTKEDVLLVVVPTEELLLLLQQRKSL